MPNVTKKRVKIAKARKFKDHIVVFIEEDGRITTSVTIYNLDATPEEIDEAVKNKMYVEVGEKISGLVGREIEIEHEEEEE